MPVDDKTCIKTAKLPRTIYKLNTTPVRIPAGSPVDSDTVTLEFTWKWKLVPRTAKTILRKDNDVTGLTRPISNLPAKL